MRFTFVKSEARLFRGAQRGEPPERTTSTSNYPSRLFRSRATEQSLRWERLCRLAHRRPLRPVGLAAGL